MKYRIPSIFSFKEPTEVFIIAEIIGDFVRVSAIESKDPSPSYTMLFSTECSCAVTEPASILSCLDTLLSKLPRFARARYILLLDRRLASTIAAGVSLLREESYQPITEPDLDALVEKGTWKILSRERAAAARNMEVGEVDVQLTSAEVLKVLLDGHRVMSPIGFTAQRVELTIRESVVRESFLREVYKRLPEERVVLIENLAGILSRLLVPQTSSRTLLAIVGPLETELYALEQSQMRYLDRIAWGSKTLLTAVAAFFGSAVSEAADLIDIYSSRAASAELLKKMESLISGELSTVLKAAEVHSKDGAGVYIYSNFDLPPLMTDPRFHKRLMLTQPPVLITEEFVSKNFGFTLNLSDIHAGSSSTSSLLSVISYLRRHTESTLGSKAAQRRVLWQQRQNV